eukprot:NODE_153_length_15389_cov_1.201439.p19 type:complete len:107 gc:universal NODE_153_length_15389_cov_1.201439:8083-8403(+)
MLQGINRKVPLYHQKPLRNQIYLTRKHPKRYCNEILRLLKDFDTVELFSSGAAIHTLCCVKMEIERLIYLPVNVPNLLIEISCSIKTYTIDQDKKLNGVVLEITKK